MKECWRDIPDYVGYYQVSDQGRVRSVDRIAVDILGRRRNLKGRVLRSNLADVCGHLGMDICKDGVKRSIKVHQLVALAWIGLCPEGQQVRHGPNGKLDNSVANLCYGTPSEDGYDKRRDGTHGGRAVRRSDGREYINMHVAAEDSDCYVSNICMVCKGVRNSTGGFGWEYLIPI